MDIIEKKGLAGSATVEMAYVMPLFFLVFVMSVYTAFYFHDKNILGGSAYETVVVGSEMKRNEQEIEEAKLKTYFNNRIKGKLIWFSNPGVSFEISDEEIRIAAKARKKGMELSVQKSARITEPEKFIRDIRRMKKMVKQ